MQKTLSILLFSLFLFLASLSSAAERVSLVVDADLEAPARHGISKLEAALLARGVVVDRPEHLTQADGDVIVLAGICPGSGPAAATLSVENVSCPEEPEAVVIRRVEFQRKPGIVLAGSDPRGLMYALLDTAQRVAWDSPPGQPFTHVRNAQEQPYVGERAVSIYTMHRAYFESRLYDKAYWERYFDMLASSRINSFAVVFGYENGGFMAPPYPYFFDVEGFPEVEMVGLTSKQQERNVAAFKDMIRTAHERGIEVTVAIWDHIYRGGVQGGGIEGASALAGEKVPGLVWGVTAENLASYNKAAVRNLLQVFPEIDALQFRMHGESGLKRSEMPRFWHEIFEIVREMRPEMRVDLRAKELPDSIIQDALDQGLRTRVTTKYWMEQMGLPFHPTHINRQNQHDRRHGYADLLRHPQQYRVHWRLWNGGTTRLLLWADPEYVRRFVKSVHLYDGNSFEINEMLATKMFAEPHDRAPLEILSPRYQYYDYEFERYWHFYQVWGRVSYNPGTPREIWEREFERRFGDEAGIHVMRGLHLASRVLPRIVAAAYEYRLFPTTRGWAEMTRMQDLPEYAENQEPSDIQQFMNVREQAKSVLKGTEIAKRRPENVSRWFAQASAQILRQAHMGETASGRGASRELISTVTDLRILGHLAKYHSQRLLAGVHYNLYKQSGDLFAFDTAIRYEQKAIEAWQQLVEAVGDVYNKYLAFGVHDKGFPRHWKEELQRLREGVKELEAERRHAGAPRGEANPIIAHVPVRRLGIDEPLHIRATIGSEAGIAHVQALIATGDGGFQSLPMKALGGGMYEASKPPLGAESELRYAIKAVDSDGNMAFYPEQGKKSPVVVLVTSDRKPPKVQLQRASLAKPGKNLKVTALVTDPSGVRRVRLRYRHVTQFEDYKSVKMIPNETTGLYEAVIPGKFIVPQWDLMYFLEALDTKGNGRIYPDLEVEASYIIVGVDRKDAVDE